MLRNTLSYTQWCSTGKDSFGQYNEHIEVGTIDIRITDLDHQINSSNPKFATSTHLGLTSSNSINKGDILKLNGLEYNVEYVIKDTRLIQVFLKKV